MPWMIPVGMGVAGAIKGGLSARSANKEAEKRNKARAMGIKFSPWTGYKAGEKAGGVDTMGAVLGGGMTGAQAGMEISSAIAAPGIATAELAEKKRFNDFLMNYYSKGGDTGGGGYNGYSLNPSGFNFRS